MSNVPGAELFESFFWVRSIAGVRMSEYFRSTDTGTSSLVLKIAETSAKNVPKNAWLRCPGRCSNNMDSEMRRVTPIILSQTPPMMEERGGLNNHLQL